MSSALLKVLLYTLLPVVATIAGGVLAAFRPPRSQVRSGVQHFAAGVVFAAVAAELLPEMLREQASIGVIAGFALGTAAMLGLKALTRRFGQPGKAKADGSVGFVATVGVDILVDGLLIGIGFAAGEGEGMLLTLALTIELLSLGLSAAGALVKTGATRATTIATTSGLALLVTVGGVAGALLVGGKSEPVLATVLAFGAAALLYLVAEEPLVEAHEEPKTLVTTTMLFVGFLLVLIIRIASG